MDSPLQMQSAQLQVKLFNYILALDTSETRFLLEWGFDENSTVAYNC